MSDIYVARRSLSIGGRRYAIGEHVMTDGLPPGKAEQLVEQRWLVLMSAPQMVATRNFTFDGQSFLLGDPFPLRGVAPEKRQQLLEHRYIQPQAPEVLV